MTLTIVGRSSSHFTRVTRMLAIELGVECSFKPLKDLLSTDVSDYGGNPAMRVPVLETPDGAWFGALSICRELQRRTTNAAKVAWPETYTARMTSNAQELVSQAMAVEVTLVVDGLSGGDPVDRHPVKLRQAMTNMLSWLDTHLDEALQGLPAERDASFLEIALFCLLGHIEFRNVVSTVPYRHLKAFCMSFAERNAARQTTYRFDT
ncbi:MAG TPA: glutathione S-transferase N-terminal domain-containing protein [Polyangiaceae bacterium]|jgi:glutathione S-transferase|nr:glutathione S-transferase N-terminal domain-containing protein [Polyangiaceae bacterium]